MKNNKIIRPWKVGQTTHLFSIVLAAAFLFFGAINLSAQSPAILVQPISQSAAPGTRVTFNVTATGTGQLHYQWKKNGADLAGELSATLVIASVVAADAGDYAVIVSNAAASTTSAVARLTVGALQMPAILTPPTNQTVSAGATVTLRASASGSAPLSFQWKKNGIEIAGETSSTLTLDAVTSADAGDYSVVVSNSAGVAESSKGTLSVTIPTAPVIIIQPKNQTVSSGSQVTFSVAASGAGQLQYQWKKNGVDLALRTSAVLIITAATSLDAGAYTVLVSNSFGSTNSLAAQLVVDSAVPPAIVGQPGSQTLTAGAQLELSVDASGSAPLSFQWRKDGVALNGKTTASLVINNVTVADAGGYSVVVSNSVGSKVSSTASVSVVEPVPPPLILVQPVSQTARQGLRVAFTVVASGSGQLQYQWMKNGVNLTGQQSATFQIDGVASVDAGDYSVAISNSSGTTVSVAARLIVNSSDAPAIEIQPANQTVAAGTTVSFRVTAQGSGALSYQWKSNGVDIAGATQAVLVLENVQVSAAGKYQVVVSNSAGAAVSDEVSLVVAAGTTPGSPDTTFLGGSISNVTAMAVQADGKIVIVGSFTNIGGVSRDRVARLESNGALDASFAAALTVNGIVRDVTLQTDGKALIAGEFTSVAGTDRKGAARLNADGSLDASFTLSGGANGPVNVIEVQGDGKIVVGGEFTTMDGTPHPYLARMNANGSMDGSFRSATGLNAPVMDIAIQSDGKIVVAGSFTAAGGMTENGLARFGSDGSLDAVFQAGLASGANVHELELQVDGKIIVAGSFNSSGSVLRTNLARLNVNGSVDSNFNAQLSSSDEVNSIAVQGGGSILVAGKIGLLGGILPKLMVRLNANGGLDLSFDLLSQFNRPVADMAVQADGRILVAASSGIVRLMGEELLPSLRILSIAKSQNSVQISFATKVGKTYALETQTSITASTWNQLSTEVGSGEVKTFTDASATSAARFYRIREQ